jgi:hypothetical protein
MQPCIGPHRSSPSISSSSLSYVSSANQFLFQSSSLIQSIFPPTCMSPSSRNTDSTPAQRGPSDHGNNMDYSFYPPRNIRRSVSEHSPISPLQPGYGTNYFTTSGGQHVHRRPARLSAGSLGSIEEPSSQNPSEHQHQQTTYAAYSPPESAPRSAPSITTSFPNDVPPRVPVQPYPSWPLPSQTREAFQQSQYTSFSPVSSNPYDSWEHQNNLQRTRAQTYMTSPTSYANLSQGEAFESAFGARRDNSSSSAPGAMQSPVATTTADSAYFRRESGAVDEFTSPSEFALFVEATSSLSINAIAPSNWSSPRNFPPPAPPSRLLAPLPPLPHQQPRSHSSPAPVSRQLTHQPSRSQLLAEALVGLDHAERMQLLGLAGDEDLDHASDDDLPDYAQSQAEASAAQRRAAARRAQELDEAWSRSRRRRG